LNRKRIDSKYAVVGCTTAQAEAQVAPERLFIECILRGKHLLEAAPDTVLQTDDLIAISSKSIEHVDLLSPIMDDSKNPQSLAQTLPYRSKKPCNTTH
jgi:hypothetical protein